MIINPVLYIAFALVFGLFALIHSLTAANWFRGKASVVMGDRYTHYRILYNVASVITFVPVFLIWARYSAYAPVIYIAPQFLHLPLYAVQVISLGAAVLTFLKFDFLEFIGLKTGASQEGQKLVTAGLYGIVRHPMYLFIIIFLWTKPAFNSLYLLAAALFTAYFVVGAFLEEKKLIKEFGAEYRRYQEAVPMFLPQPFFSLRSKKR
ncbi:MAG: isoprenylcysteine carboxylmethyltransferase family protein [Candidatus Hydrothermarchaeaceae archaeon]